MPLRIQPDAVGVEYIWDFGVRLEFVHIQNRLSS